MKKISLALVPLLFMGASCSLTQTTNNNSASTNTATTLATNTNSSVVSNTNTNRAVSGTFAVNAEYPDSYAKVATEIGHINNLYLSLNKNPNNAPDSEFHGADQARLRVYFVPSAEVTAGSYIDKLVQGDTSAFSNTPTEDGVSMGISTTLLSTQDVTIDGLSGKQYYTTSATSQQETSDFALITVLQAPNGIVHISAGHGNGDTKDQLKVELLDIIDSLQFTF